ncbi:MULTISPECIES: YitT family protein [Desulfosediminicola]|uniref:YitT family protein n=1 Tax=Desulfosediminicola TaxID=2886823 RepID=UPI0010ABDD40|nr:YitT family protein [Desulfosediminicola ganghwensis]
MGFNLKDYRYSVIWNLFLLTAGSLLFTLGMNGIVMHQDFIPGGLFGFCLFIFYNTDLLTPAIWFILLNIPTLILGWLYVSRRFVLYTIYGVSVIFLSSQFIEVDFGIHDQFFAAIAGGFVVGAGTGIILRSIGSSGGLDVIAILLYRKFNFGVGKTYMVFNVLLFSLVLTQYGADIFIASIIMTFVASNSLDYFLTLSNQRKIVYVISEKSEQIGKDVTERLNLRATFIHGKGAYTGNDKDILMTITNNLMLKRLEEAVFTVDEDALFIVENSYDVIGNNFNKRKVY